MTTTKPLPHLLTIEELADHLGVTVRHIRRPHRREARTVCEVAALYPIRPR